MKIFVSAVFNYKRGGVFYQVPYSEAEAECSALGDTRLASSVQVRHAFDQGYE